MCPFKRIACVLRAIAFLTSIVAFFAMPMAIADEAVIDIRSSELTESSGLAVSRRAPQHLWTHNDSGGEPKLFAVNRDGEVTGSVSVQDASVADWEDIASFSLADKHWIVIADVGDNLVKRETVTLYFLEEPDPTQNHRLSPTYHLTLSYPEGPENCEAVAIDPKHGEIVMVTKNFLPKAQVFTVPLPTAEKLTSNESAKLMLQPRGSLVIPLVSAMDIDSRTGDLILVNYFQCFRFTRKENDRKHHWVTQLPEVTELPKLKQIEAVAITPEREVWVTSEGEPAKLALARKLATESIQGNE